MPVAEIAPIANPKTGLSQETIQAAIRAHFQQPGCHVLVTNIAGASYRVNVKRTVVLSTRDVKIPSEVFAGSYFIAAHVENGKVVIYDRTQGSPQPLKERVVVDVPAVTKPKEELPAASRDD